MLFINGSSKCPGEGRESEASVAQCNDTGVSHQCGHAHAVSLIGINLPMVLGFLLGNAWFPAKKMLAAVALGKYS